MAKPKPQAKQSRMKQEDRQPLTVYLLVNMDGTAVGSDYLATFIVLGYSEKQARSLAEDRGQKEGCDLTIIGVVPEKYLPKEVYQIRVKRIHAGAMFDQDKMYLAFPEHEAGGPAFRPTEEDVTTGKVFRMRTPFTHDQNSLEYRHALDFFCRLPWGKSTNQHALEREQPLLETAYPNPYRDEGDKVVSTPPILIPAKAEVALQGTLF